MNIANQFGISISEVMSDIESDLHQYFHHIVQITESEECTDLNPVVLSLQIESQPKMVIQANPKT